MNSKDELPATPAVHNEPLEIIPEGPVPESPQDFSHLHEEVLAPIIGQPGVIAVSAFFEGFSVLMRGSADFELVAAMAQDFLTSAERIASQVRIGGVEQIILESKEGKFIIAPYRDLFLCVLTSHNANLGLIRLSLRSLQEKAS